ncbi:MAG: hypothetical protein KGL35_32270, partial [Bradyrhizobium sp.]|nr:hypothetical protein [Bradyrhizobium sp.]
LYTAPRRFPSLPAKFNALLQIANQPDAYLVWEDDDLYLPEYVARHAEVLARRQLSKPAAVLSDYPGQIVIEGAAGRFHSTLGFRRELIEHVGGWPPTSRADFDQQLIDRLFRAARTSGDPFAQQLCHAICPTANGSCCLPYDHAGECRCDECFGNFQRTAQDLAQSIPFVYRWHTGQPHGQATMRAPDDESWYHRAADLLPPRFVGRLEPRLDAATHSLLTMLLPGSSATPWRRMRGST